MDQLFFPTAMLMMERLHLVDIIFPHGFNTSYPRSATEVRSSFQFKFHCCLASEGTAGQSKGNAELREKWVDLVKTWVLPQLNVPDGDESDALPFHVYYDGDMFEEIEVMETLMRDIKLA